MVSVAGIPPPLSKLKEVLRDSKHEHYQSIKRGLSYSIYSRFRQGAHWPFVLAFDHFDITLSPDVFELILNAIKMDY